MSLLDSVRLRVRVVSEGMHPDERLLEFLHADGYEAQLFAWSRHLEGDLLGVSIPLSRRGDGALLVELPHETTYGANRVWVDPVHLAMPEVLSRHWTQGPPADWASARTRAVPAPPWKPIEDAPCDGEPVWTYTAAYEDLPSFQSPCAWHPDAGWCTDELRRVTHWMWMHEMWVAPPPGAQDALPVAPAPPS